MNTDGEAALSVISLAKRYGAIEAVSDVSFSLCRGEIFGLLGPNGAGKTTTLECVAGLRTLDRGAIRAAGPLGVQLQAASLQDKITPRQALDLFGAFYRDAYPVDELLERFDLTTRAGAHFTTLSGGERQRLFLALALINRPAILILDEPTAGLDPNARRALRELIREQAGEGRAVLLSTHDLEEAEHLCDRVAILDGGRIAAQGSPAELIARATTPARIRLTTEPRLERAQVERLPGVISATTVDVGWILTTQSPSRLIAAAAEAAELRHIELRQPSLEDVFREVTGHGWRA